MMVGEWLDCAEVSSVEGQDGVRSKLGSDGNIHGIGEIELKVEVASPNGLRGVEDGGGYLWQYCAPRAHPVADVIDGLMCSVAAC